MHPRSLTVLSLLILVLVAPAAQAGTCSDWAAGPLDNGSAPNGADALVYTSTMWDPDGAGPQLSRLVIGGTFSSVEGVPVNQIAMRDPVTGEWQPLGSGPESGGSVAALFVYNGELIVGGTFTSIDGVAANNIARLNGTIWQPLGTGTNGSVYSLTTFGGELIAAGLFGDAGGVSVGAIARWNGTSWHAVGSGTNSSIYCMETFGGDLVVGGAFDLAGGASANRVARWDGVFWHPLGTGTNAYVSSLTLYNGELIAGGQFTTAGGVAASRVARWNGGSWQTLGSGLDDTVYALKAYNGNLIAGGHFSFSGVTQVVRIGIWNGSVWGTLGGNGVQGDVRHLNVPNGELLIGGDFTASGGMVLNHLAHFDAGGFGPFGGGTALSAHAMTTFGSRLVIGGSFNQSTTGALAHNIIGWDGASLTPFGSGITGTVEALLGFKYPGIFGSYELIAGGSFTNASGVATSNIARWVQSVMVGTPLAWAPMGAGFNSTVRAIERFGGFTYAGGSFTASGTTTLNRIARWNESSHAWEAVGTGMNGPVYALKVFNGALYAGGAFTTAGGVSTGGLARWTGSAWNAVGGSFVGLVYALEVHNNQLIIGGLYPGFTGSPNIAGYTGSNYFPLGAGGTNAVVRALKSTGANLYVGGDFTTAGGLSANRVARWNGTSWSQVEGGASAPVYALGLYHDEVHAVGDFLAVGLAALPSPRWGRFIEIGAPWIAHQPVSRTSEPGTEVTFSVDPADGYNGLSFQWSKDGIALADGPTATGSIRSGATTSSLSIQIVTLDDAGAYTVEVSNGCGSDTSLVANLTVPGTVDAPRPGTPGATVYQAIGPNPTASEARLTFSLAREAQVGVRVHDVMGRLVRRIDAGRLPAGPHQETWDARGTDGQRVRAGLYFVGLEVDGRGLGTKRLAIVR
jgi:hypothetical protein